MKTSFLPIVLFGIAFFLAEGPGSHPLRQEFLPLAQHDSLTITDLVLIYRGGTHPPAWNVDKLLPYVSYLDPVGKREQCLFDGRELTAALSYRPRFYSYLEFFEKNPVIDSSATAYHEGGGPS